MSKEIYNKAEAYVNKMLEIYNKMNLALDEYGIHYIIPGIGIRKEIRGCSSQGKYLTFAKQLIKEETNEYTEPYIQYCSVVILNASTGKRSTNYYSAQGIEYSIKSYDESVDFMLSLRYDSEELKTYYIEGLLKEYKFYGGILKKTHINTWNMISRILDQKLHKLGEVGVGQVGQYNEKS